VEQDIHSGNCKGVGARRTPTYVKQQATDDGARPRVYAFTKTNKLKHELPKASILPEDNLPEHHLGK